METIYFGDGNQKYKSIKELLKDYFERQNPQTYFTISKNLQCRERRNRSIDDLLLLCNHYFPNTTIKDMMSEMLLWSEEYLLQGKCIIISTCSTIQRVKLNLFVYSIDMYGKDTENMLYIPAMKNGSKALLSQYQMADLQKILNEIISERREEIIENNTLQKS